MSNESLYLFLPPPVFSSPNGNVAQDTRDLSQSLQQLARSTQNIQSGDIQGNLLQLVDSIKKVNSY